MKIDFIKKANCKFNNKFTYGNDYVSSKKLMTINCPIHGEYKQTPHSHYNSVHGCPQCAKEFRKGKLTLSSFIKKANKIHNNKFDYSKSIIINSHIHTIVICPIHGEFLVTPGNHLNINKFDCPKCGRESAGKSTRLSTKNYIDMVKIIHNNKYNYSKTIYTKAHDKIIVICPEHGEWTPTASNHKNNKSGCPQCACINKTISRYEIYIADYLTSCSIKFSREQTFIGLINPKTNCKLRVDFWLPTYNTIIEYDGEHHFNPIKYGNQDPYKLLIYTKYKDNIKNKFCKDNNIKLIRVPYTIHTKNTILAFLITNNIY